MNSDIPGKVVGILLAFVLCIIFPFVIISTEEEMISRRLIVEEVSSFIDSVIDGRVITDAELRELNASLAAHGMLLDYDIHRYVRSVNPDPTKEEGYLVSYIERDDNMKYDKGDKVSIHVYEVSHAATSTLSHKLTGLYMRDFDLTITARVR